LTLVGSRVWRACAPFNLALVAFVLFFAGLRIARPGTVFYYTEGPVLGSLAALEAEGDLADLYPADGWLDPPVVLTLYPPAYFVAASVLDRGLGTEGTFVGLRVLSALALVGVLALLTWHARRRVVSRAWMLALTGAALMTPAVYRLAGGAQADLLALLMTWAGITLVLGARDDAFRSSALPLVGAGVAFLLAFFCKQSFVAAPAAVVVSLLLAKRVRAAAFLAGGLAAGALAGVAALDARTSGGYLANTFGALTGSAHAENLWSSLAASEPLQWAPLVVVVLLAARSRLRPGFPEIYLLASTALHTAAMLKTGSSSNYLLEPTFAVLLLAVTRSTSGDAAAAMRPPRVPSLTGLLAPLCAAALGLTALRAVLREQAPVRGWLASAESVHVSEFEGLPLVDAFFIPALLERGGRPWLNDPYAFGVLQESGRWDPVRLVSDLQRRRVPFALTTVDLEGGPAPPGAGTRDLVMAYFWRSPAIWGALTAGYRPLASGPITVWLPGEGGSP